MRRSGPAIAALLVVCTGCGGKTRSTQPVVQAKPVLTSGQQGELARLRADVRRIRIAAAPVHHSLMGTPKLLAATGKFLDDEEPASLDNLTKNRMIDFAASAVAGSCEQCFQQLEANRPIAGSMKTH